MGKDIIRFLLAPGHDLRKLIMILLVDKLAQRRAQKSASPGWDGSAAAATAFNVLNLPDHLGESRACSK